MAWQNNGPGQPVSMQDANGAQAYTLQGNTVHSDLIWALSNVYRGDALLADRMAFTRKSEKFMGNREGGNEEEDSWAGR